MRKELTKKEYDAEVAAFESDDNETSKMFMRSSSMKDGEKVSTYLMIETVHSNEDMDPETYVFSDEKYDYCIVNGESLTRYYGSIGGEYESCPIHKMAYIDAVLSDSEWMQELLRQDAKRDNFYKHHDKINYKN